MGPRASVDVFVEENLLFLHRNSNPGQFSLYKGADMSLARPASRCILFDGENISFDASLVIYT
jgi:hypothetical protein